MLIGTHDGVFHADEAFAVYLLKLLPEWKDAQVLRSRDMDQLANCDVLLDVGLKHLPPKYLDHHQPEFDEYFPRCPRRTQMSSAGLAYKHFGREALAELLHCPPYSPVVTAIYKSIYIQFVQAIDAQDNNVRVHIHDALGASFNTYPTSLPGVVSCLNPTLLDDRSREFQDSQFHKACAYMGTAFEAFVHNYATAWYPAREGVTNAFEQRYQNHESGRIIELGVNTFFKGHVHTLELRYETEILYVLYPFNETSFRLLALPPPPPGSTDSRVPLPESWRNLQADELCEKCGIADCEFVNKTGYIAGTKTRAAALEMARASMSELKKNLTTL